MRRTTATIAILGLVAACGIIAPDDTARMPPNQYGGPAMTPDDAIMLSSWALKDPATTRGNPELAARAIAAEDWLAGQRELSPDFGQYAPVAEVPWGGLRREVRGAIGVAPGTPSQVVVDRLLAVAAALHAGKPDPAAALQPPAFTLGPAGTLAALANLPPFANRELAYVDLGRHEDRPTGNCLASNC